MLKFSRKGSLKEYLQKAQLAPIVVEKTNPAKNFYILFFRFSTKKCYLNLWTKNIK